MIGNSDKFSRKQEAAIIALLNMPTIAGAAKRAGISEATLWRWLQMESFQQRYQEAKSQAFGAALGRLQQATGEAVEVLREVAADPIFSTPSSRVSAARAILELAIKVKEAEDLEARIVQIEKMLQKRGNSYAASSRPGGRS